MRDKEIYSFDFDGTIVTNEYPKIGKPIKQVIGNLLDVLGINGIKVSFDGDDNKIVITKIEGEK